MQYYYMEYRYQQSITASARPFDAEISPGQQMQRRVVAPVPTEHFELVHRHGIDLGKPIAADRRQHAVNMRQAAAAASPWDKSSAVTRPLMRIKSASGAAAARNSPPVIVSSSQGWVASG